MATTPYFWLGCHGKISFTVLLSRKVLLMKKPLVAAILSIFAGGAQADAGAMVGVAYNFGGPASLKNLGFTAKVLTSDREDKWVAALGATLYPWSDKLLGLDVSGGYNFEDSAVLIGYDFLKGQPQISGGWANTDDDSSSIQEGPSDIRLKRDIQLLTTLPDGMKIYAFKYLWSDEHHVGVMAQDLLEHPVWRSAVVTQANGFYAVNYAMLGLKMATLDEWNKRGLAAISLHEHFLSLGLVANSAN
jgi:hypothetical protein